MPARKKAEDDRTVELQWVSQVQLGYVTVVRNTVTGVVTVVVVKPPTGAVDEPREATRTVMDATTAGDLFAALGLALQTKAPG